MSKLFKKLKKGLEEIIAFEEGKITLTTELIEIPKKKRPGLIGRYNNI